MTHYQLPCRWSHWRPNACVYVGVSCDHLTSDMTHLAVLHAATPLMLSLVFASSCRAGLTTLTLTGDHLWMDQNKPASSCALYHQLYSLKWLWHHNDIITSKHNTHSSVTFGYHASHDHVTLKHCMVMWWTDLLFFCMFTNAIWCSMTFLHLILASDGPLCPCCGILPLVANDGLSAMLAATIDGAIMRSQEITWCKGPYLMIWHQSHDQV